MSVTTDAIRRAADALTIQDVYLRASRLSLAAEYDPKIGPEVKTTNLNWGVKRAQMLEVETTDTSEKITLWKVEFQVRCRLFRELSEGKEPTNERIDANALATIEAIFIAEYRMKDPTVSHEALAEFSKHNVAFHVWPYWREHLHDITSRALLPRVTLPMHIFTPQKVPEVPAEQKKLNQ